MKKFLPLLLALSVCFASCAALAAADAEAEKEGAALAKAAVSSKDIRIEVNNVVSQYSPSIQSNGDYYLQIKDGKASAYLPFFGTSTYAAYGSSEGGIRFDDCPVKITDMKGRKSKGETKWKFTAKTEREEVEVVISFFDNGSASINCDSSSRSPMNYHGSLEPLE